MPLNAVAHILFFQFPGPVLSTLRATLAPVLCHPFLHMRGISSVNLLGKEFLKASRQIHTHTALPGEQSAPHLGCASEDTGTRDRRVPGCHPWPAAGGKRLSRLCEVRPLHPGRADVWCPSLEGSRRCLQVERMNQKMICSPKPNGPGAQMPNPTARNPWDKCAHAQGRPGARLPALRLQWPALWRDGETGGHREPMGILGFAKPAHRLSSSAFCGRERCSNIKGASPEHRGTESFPRAFLQGGDGETQPRDRAQTRVQIPAFASNRLCALKESLHVLGSQVSLQEGEHMWVGIWV